MLGGYEIHLYVPGQEPVTFEADDVEGAIDRLGTATPILQQYFERPANLGALKLIEIFHKI